MSLQLDAKVLLYFRSWDMGQLSDGLALNTMKELFNGKY